MLASKKYYMIPLIIISGIIFSFKPPVENQLVNKEWRIITIKNQASLKIDTITKLDYSIFFEAKSMSIFMDENECSVVYQLEPKNTMSIFAGHNCHKNQELSKIDKSIIKTFLELNHFELKKDTLFLNSDENSLLLIQIPKKD